MMTFLLLSLAAAGVSAMLWSLYHDPSVRNRRALRKASSTRIRDFVEGSFGKVVGAVEAKGTKLDAPLTHRRCVYYKLTVQREVRAEDGHGYSWRDIYLDESAQHFLIKDQDDRALVVLDGARVHVAENEPFVTGSLGDFSEEVQHALMAIPEVAGVAALGIRLRYVEHILEPGALVGVMGYGVFQPDPDPAAAPADYRGVASQLVMQGRPGQPLLISDEPSITAS